MFFPSLGRTGQGTDHGWWNRTATATAADSQGHLIKRCQNKTNVSPPIINGLIPWRYCHVVCNNIIPQVFFSNGCIITFSVYIKIIKSDTNQDVIWHGKRQLHILKMKIIKHGLWPYGVIHYRNVRVRLSHSTRGDSDWCPCRRLQTAVTNSG